MKKDTGERGRERETVYVHKLSEHSLSLVKRATGCSLKASAAFIWGLCNPAPSEDYICAGD